jgi:hypothetical protein
MAPYRWARPKPPDRLSRLIKAACQRQLEALTFTSAPAAAATPKAAERLGVRREFVQALSDYVASAAVGPLTAEPLREAGINPVIPDRHRLGALVRLVTDELAKRHIRRFRRDEVIIELPGGQISVNDRQISLGPNSFALLIALASSNAVLSTQELIARLPDNPGEHALHMAMSRLRRARTRCARSDHHDHEAWLPTGRRADPLSELLRVTPRVDQLHPAVGEVPFIASRDHGTAASCDARDLCIHGIYHSPDPFLRGDERTVQE